MSGGHFNYTQHNIRDIFEDIEKEIRNNGKIKTSAELKEEGWIDSDWYEKYPEDLKHYEYPEEVIEEFKKGVEILKKAYIYAHRIDWLLSGDDGEESFLSRLKEELNKIN